MSCWRCNTPAWICAQLVPIPPYCSIRNAPGFDGIRLLFPSGPLKYDAGQLLKLAREHCAADVCACGATTAVAAEVPLVEPAEFDADTVTRIVAPTSPDPNRSVDPVTLATQLLPAESQRYH
jgi:hypothetical protein